MGPEAFEMAGRGSLDSRGSFDLSSEDPESQNLVAESYSHGRQNSFLERLILLIPLRKLGFHYRSLSGTSRTKPQAPRKARSRILGPRRLWFSFQLLLVAFISIVTLTAMLGPSYSRPPARYHELRLRGQSSSEPGRANSGREKVFIAASIYDRKGELAGGPWGERVLHLIDLLGPSNVFLSIYGNGSGGTSKAALGKLRERVKCDHAIVYEDKLDSSQVPHVHLPDGTSRIKRIAYLAEVRNRALRPLETSKIKYDKLLYVNDIIFDPIDAAQLLFSTNAESGQAEYRAACSMDFINPFKFYDTFASRDLEGYSMGLPIYPWFSSAGRAESRRDVVNQKDAVRVRSCWGGMVAFDAKFFQSRPDELEESDVAGDVTATNFTGFRFRAEQDLYWDAAECCLIQADIQGAEEKDRGIYMNPYVRVAYDTRTLSWLGWTRRIEKIYKPFQYIINVLVGLPWHNPRRAEQPWQEVQERVWVPDPNQSSGGSFQMIDRIAGHTGFCGRRGLELLRENPKPGEKSWEFLPAPNG
jgi:Cryptococcal mannosyltransferase 1